MKRSTLQAAGVLSAVFILGGVTGGALVVAQGAHSRGHPPQHAKGRVERLAHDLDLSDEQERKVLKIFNATRPQFDHLRREAMRNRDNPLRQLVEERDAKIRALLTPAQQEAFDALQQERRERWRRHPPPPPPPPG